MKIMNPFSSAGNWKVDPDRKQDRGSGPVIEYKLSPEEIQAKYGKVTGNGKKIIRLATSEEVSEKNKKLKGEDEMKSETKITKEQLIAECMEHGISKAAREEICKKYGTTMSNVRSRITQYKIKELLDEEKQAAVKEVIESAKVECEKPIKPGMKINEEFEKAVQDMEKKNIDRYNKRDYVKPEIIPVGTVYEEEKERIIAPKRFGLKPKTLISQDTKFEYVLNATELIIMSSGDMLMEVMWEDVPILIEELQEVRRICEG